MARPWGNHLHFIGIGGIGMSGIAALLKKQGYRISGCDTDINQKSIVLLKSLGCSVSEGNLSIACSDITINAIVRTSAVKEDHPEIQIAREKGLPVLHRAEVLAELTRHYKTIAISGSHGKTTTTSLISHVLTHANIDPTCIVGGHMQNTGTNFRFGEGPYLVAEADESDRSLLLLHPSIAVITNIDLEHLDTYHDKTDIKKTFELFIQRLPNEGHAFVGNDDPLSRELLNELSPLLRNRVTTFGSAPDSQIHLTDYGLEADQSRGTVQFPQQRPFSFILPLPGKHNLLNALAALAVGHKLGLSPEIMQEALATFKGVEQRFTYRGMFQGASIFDDYAHHPTEIASALAVAKKKKRGALHVIFQPHRFSRTQKLWTDFVTVLADPAIDQLIIVPIYPASEPPIEGVTSEKLVEEINSKKNRSKALFLPLEKDYQSLINALKPTVQKDDLLLFLGAGKVNRLAVILASPERIESL